MVDEEESTGPGSASLSGPPPLKEVLYFSPDPACLRDLMARFEGLPGCLVDGPMVETSRVRLLFHAGHDASGIVEALRRRYFNLVVLDVRGPSAAPSLRGARASEAMALLDLMGRESDVEARYGFHRVIALVSGSDDATDRLVAALGSRRVGRVMRGPGPFERTGPEWFAGLALEELVRMVLERRPGGRALCCSGGGVTGIFFEMGALKCLNDCLRPAHSVSTFDMYFGISAGAVVAGMLASGYTIDQCLLSVAGGPGRLPRVDLNVFRWSMLDRSDIGARLARGVRGLASGIWRRGTGGRPSIDSLMLEYSDLLGPPLRSDEFERALRRLFEEAGTGNHFRRLPRTLYVGATDQDLRTHRLFGEPGFDEVPVSRAIQASLSLNPAFSSTLIDGRFYCDGAVTHTSHLRQAIDKGADLVFVIDPFLPYVSREPGYSRGRGFLYNIDQDLRTLSYTRFEVARASALRSHPGVSSYTFVPANSLRKHLSMNPMDHRPYLLIWRGAYLSTLKRIQWLRHRMAGDLAFHGVTLDTARAEEVAARLRSSTTPSLSDFWAGGARELGRRLPEGAEELAPADAGAAAARP